MHIIPLGNAGKMSFIWHCELQHLWKAAFHSQRYVVLSNLVERGTALAKIEKCEDLEPNQFFQFPGATISEGKIDPLSSHHVILAHLFFSEHRDVYLYHRQFKVLPRITES